MVVCDTWVLEHAMMCVCVCQWVSIHARSRVNVANVRMPDFQQSGNPHFRTFGNPDFVISEIPHFRSSRIPQLHNRYQSNNVRNVFEAIQKLFQAFRTVILFVHLFDLFVFFTCLFIITWAHDSESLLSLASSQSAQTWLSRRTWDRRTRAWEHLHAACCMCMHVVPPVSVCLSSRGV